MYQIGGSLQNDSPSYVERVADTELYEALKRGEFCYVLNSRQMGKSSLLVRTRYKLEAEGIKCTTIDLTNIGSKNVTPNQWYKGIVGELWRGFKLLGKVNLKKWWKEAEDISLLQRLSRFISDVILKEFSESNIVIFVDEIDSILSLDFSVDDFFALIRFCYNQRSLDPEYKRITFAIFGVATPSDLIQDKTRTPFNIGRAIELQGLALAQVEPLAAGLQLERGNNFEVIEHILAWTDGQPFLTQKLCKLAIELLVTSLGGMVNIPPGNEGFWVESIVRTKILHNWESQDEPEHLRTIRDRIQRNEKRAAKLLGIYQLILQGQEIKADDRREQTELVLSGLVVKKDGLLQVKNRIYAEIFNREWVAKQLNSLRPYSQVLEAWIASNKSDRSRLLRGQALKDAREWSQGKSLSDLDYEFLSASVDFDKSEIQKALEAEKSKAIEAQLEEERKRLIQEQKNSKLQKVLLGGVGAALVIVSGLGIATYKQYQIAQKSEREARISQIKALLSSAEANYKSNQRLDGVLSAIEAKKRLQNLEQVESNLSDRASFVLTKLVYAIEEYNRLIGHDRGLWGVDISPDGELIVSASADKTIKIWQKNGKLLRTLTGHNSRVFRVTFSPDGELIASSSADGTVKLWQKNGELLRTLKADNKTVLGVTFSPDGEIIASSSGDGTIKLWDRNGELLRTLKAHKSAAIDVDFSPDGKKIASASDDKTVKLWSVDGTLLDTLTEHTAGVKSVAISPDGKIIASASEDKTVKLWKIDGREIVTLKGHNEPVLGVAWSNDGQLLASASADNTVKIWHRDGRLQRTLRGHNSVVKEVAFSPDDKIIASASDDKTVKLWKLDNSLYDIFNGDGSVLVWSKNGNSIASASRGNGNINLFEKNGKLLRSIKAHSGGILDLDFSQNNLLASASLDTTLKIWQTDGKLLRSFAENAIVWDIAFNSDGSKIVSGLSDNTVKLWQTNGTLLAILKGHTAEVRSLSWSIDDRLIASSSLDNTIKLWQAEDGSLWNTLNGHTAPVRSIDFSPDGEIIASASVDETIKLWQIDGTLLKTLSGHQAPVWDVEFSQDDRLIASASLDRTIKIWSRDGTLLKTLPLDSRGIRSIAFSPDSKILASNLSKDTLIFLNVDNVLNLDELEYACNWVKDYLATNPTLEQSDRLLCDRVESSE